MPRWFPVFAFVLAVSVSAQVRAQTEAQRRSIQNSNPTDTHKPPIQSRRSTPRPQPPSDDTPSLLSPVLLATLQRSAGSIFRGTVLSEQWLKPTRSDEMETLLVTFRIDDAFRGVRKGRTFSIREWSGLWQSGDRYRVGERVLLFLYPPSRIGLTSPVGGRFERFDIDDRETVGFHGSHGRFPARPLDREPAGRNQGRIRYRELARAIRAREE